MTVDCQKGHVETDALSYFECECHSPPLKKRSHEESPRPTARLALNGDMLYSNASLSLEMPMGLDGLRRAVVK
jgi:hypothetical protein